MKTSELIAALQEAKDKWGDLDVVYDYDGHWCDIFDIERFADFITL